LGENKKPSPIGESPEKPSPIGESPEKLSPIGESPEKPSPNFFDFLLFLEKVKTFS